MNKDNLCANCYFMDHCQAESSIEAMQMNLEYSPSDIHIILDQNENMMECANKDCWPERLAIDPILPEVDPLLSNTQE